MDPLSPTIPTTATTPYKIVRIYLKGASSEVPDMSSLSRGAISPHVAVDMQTLAHPAWPGAMECVLRISLHARLEGKTVFLIEVSEAGVFELDVSNMEEAHRFVRKIAPSVLFPFARKELASLAVAAGFQPVLLDHIDFDSMLDQVIKAQRLTRAPTPMRLDVIAAKPAAAPVSVAQAKAAPDWSDTLPEPAMEAIQAAQEPGLVELRQAPPPMAPPAKRGLPTKEAPKRSWRYSALALLAVASAGASLAWWLQPKPTRVADGPVARAPAAQARPPATSVAALPPPPAAAVAPVATLSPETQMAIDISRERLAEQPANWFTLDLGLAPITTPPATLYPVAADRPVFVKAAGDGSLRVLYGVFPSRAAAELVKSQLARPVTVVTIGSL